MELFFRERYFLNSEDLMLSPRLYKKVFFQLFKIINFYLKYISLVTLFAWLIGRNRTLAPIEI